MGCCCDGLMLNSIFRLYRSLLSRDAKGRVCAGLYFPVSNGGGDAQLTLFYDGPNDSSVKVKQKFATFKDEEKVSLSSVVLTRNSNGNSFCNFLFQSLDSRRGNGPFGAACTSIVDGNGRFDIATEIIVRCRL